MSKKTITEQIDRKLNGLMRIGESRHKAKAEAREVYQAKYGKSPGVCDVVVPTIHSIKTREVYQEHCNRFAKWCVDTGKANKYARLDKIEQYAAEYLKAKQAEGLSPYSLASMKSAFAKLYGHEIDYSPPQKYTKQITRSRNQAIRDKDFNEELHSDLVAIAKGTGGRRSDLAKLRPDDFREIDGRLWVFFRQSKGGRDRLTPVLPKYADEIREIISTAEKGKPIFDRINSHADIHSYRREYCQHLYKNLHNNKKFRKAVEREYPVRTETNIKSPLYIAQDGSKFWRDDIFLCSQALGHNRLNTTVEHYLTN